MHTTESVEILKYRYEAVQRDENLTDLNSCAVAIQININLVGFAQMELIMSAKIKQTDCEKHVYALRSSGHALTCDVARDICFGRGTTA